MGFFSTVLSIGSSVCSGISSALSSIGSTVSSFCSNILPKISGALNVVGQIAGNFLQAMGILQPNEKLENMGDKAIQAADAGIQPGSFTKYEEYLAAIRGFELDPEKSAKTNTESKIAAGLAVGSWCVDKKLNFAEGTTEQLWPLVAASPDYFNADRLVQFTYGVRSVESVIDYFSGSLSASARKETLDELITVEQKNTPEKSREEAYEQISAAEDKIRHHETE